MRVAVLGATGFVGTACTTALRALGLDVIGVRAPRLQSSNLESAACVTEARSHAAGLAVRLQGVQVVVNAAGVTDAASSPDAVLIGANALLPAVVAHAAVAAGVQRMVHVSTAAVQGRSLVLDESHELAPFNAYSRSKAVGEQVLVPFAGILETIAYRPTSVHGVGRQVTLALAEFARGRWSSVAGQGTAPTPQTLLANVASAVSLLVTAEATPRVVLHPSEGMTTAGILECLSAGRRPRRLPERVCRSVVSAGFAAGRTRPSLLGHARRLEVLWFGQAQISGWLSTAGFSAPAGREAWEQLGVDLGRQQSLRR